MVVIDTDILIDAGRGVNEAVDCLKRIEQKSDIAISVVTQMELIIGCRNRDELLSLELFLKRSQIIKIDEAISDKSVELLKQYRLSHGLLIADALIAATAIVTDHQLVSKNQKDYRFIEGLQLLPYPNPFD
jgi:predicted nucleic acid-binding protein